MSEQDQAVDDVIAAAATTIATLLGNMQVRGIDPTGLSQFIGRTVIVRSTSNQAWIGTLAKKWAEEVILHDARRMKQWRLAKGVALSSTVLHCVADPTHKDHQVGPLEAETWLQVNKIVPVPQHIAEQIYAIPETKVD